MSDFLIYAARLQDAGISQLRVVLDASDDGTRLMRVSPAITSPTHPTVEMMQRYPERTFELCGTDRVLEKLKDDMAYSDTGPTAEKLKAAIEAHPMLRDDLVTWFADYLLCKPALDEPPDLSPEDAAAAERMGERLKGMLRGLDIARNRAAAAIAEKKEGGVSLSKSPVQGSQS